MNFIARKLSAQKSKCKENGKNNGKMTIFAPCSFGVEILKNLLFRFQRFTCFFS